MNIHQYIETIRFFKSYLSNRKQYVKYEGIDSECWDITCGVPQGSVLGPLLFILYTNDLPDCIHHSNTILFADDTTIYTSSNNIESLYVTMNANLNNLSDWFRANKLSLNTSKTNYILFSKSNNVAPGIDLFISDQKIERVNYTKFLGIYIDEKLKWDKHINKVRNHIASSLFILNKIKNFVPTKLLLTLYYSLIYPYLTYGITLWGAACKTVINKLYVIQKKAIRTILKANYNAHTEPLCKKLKLMKVEEIYKYYVSQFMYAYVLGKLPLSLLNWFKFVGSREGYPNTRAKASKYSL